MTARFLTISALIGSIAYPTLASAQTQHIECPQVSAQIPVNPIQDKSWTIYGSTIAKIIKTAAPTQGFPQPTLICTYQHDLGVFTLQKPAPAQLTCSPTATGFDCNPAMTMNPMMNRGPNIRMPPK